MMRGRAPLACVGKWVFCMVMLLGAVGSVSAKESQPDDRWRYNFAIYLWGAGIEGTTQSGSEIDIPFDEIVDNLDMAFMGAFEARRGKWSAAVDVVYMDTSADKSGTISPGEGLPISIPVDADVGLEGWVWNLNGARNVYEGDRASVDVLFGARYLDIDAKLTVSVGSLSPDTVKVSDSWLDVVAGVKGEVKLSKHWKLPYYLDVGTGQSDFTWQGLFGVGYAFKWGGVGLAYRNIDWEFDSGSGLKDLNFSGPLVGVDFRF